MDAMLFKGAFPRGDCRLENSLEVEKRDVMDVQGSWVQIFHPFACPPSVSPTPAGDTHWAWTNQGSLAG